MKTFRDNAGRVWSVSVTVAAIKRCRALAGVDLYGLVDDGFSGLAKLLGDPVALIDVLYVLCRDEAERAGVTDEAFGSAMAGDAVAAASAAFLEEYADFFPDPRVRAGLKKVIEAGRTVQGLMLDRMGEELDRIDPASLAAGWSGSSGSSRASSASTPAP